MTDDDKPQSSSLRQWLFSVAEVAFIVLLFFVYYSEPPPGRNEAHYLAKAKHYWNPTWCQNDAFLNSDDAHLVFYWSLGWLTLFFSLPATAWIGRFATWLLMAWSWRRLSHALAPLPLMSVLSAAMFVLLLHYTHMAGEWVIGGVEAKGFAFVFVFLGLEAIVKGRWLAVWPLLGVAASFHVLVGGWAVIAAGVAWFVGSGWRSWSWWLPLSVAGGFVLSLPGLAPAIWLTQGIEPEIVNQANQIYVFYRLPHHLAPSQFPIYEKWGFVLVSHYILRHAGLAVAWFMLWFLTRGAIERRRLNGFVCGAVLIAITGVCIDFGTLNHPDIGAKLLRYYWFRLSDVAVPIGVSLGICAGVAVWLQHRSPTEPNKFTVRYIAGCWFLIACLMSVSWLYWRTATEHFGDWRPDADRQSLPVVPNDLDATIQIYHDWRDVCDWIRKETEPDAVFFTPQRQQTFKWYAHRGEVVSYKDVPQDAEALVDWAERYYYDVFPDDRAMYGLTFHRESEIIDMAKKYNAKYLLIDRRKSRRRPRFKRLYPPPGQNHASYEVYRIPEN